HGNFCAVGYHNPKREKVSGPMGSNPALASALNAKGYLTQRGKPFTRESVRTLLKNLGVHTVGAEEECSKEQ
ncbi:hypothetical protein, partial [Aeromonas hydrophila]|uniref:hypothetical protein n=1 Tax=Aeromonas hydrophila TaxID=644 RepID=UPI00195D62E6